MRRRLTPKEKARIIQLDEAGRVPRDIATALQRSLSTIYNFLQYGRFTPRTERRNFCPDSQKRGPRPLRDELAPPDIDRHRSAKRHEARSATCPGCGRKLTLDTDGNGYLVEYCLTCVKPAA